MYLLSKTLSIIFRNSAGDYVTLQTVAVHQHILANADVSQLLSNLDGLAGGVMHKSGSQERESFFRLVWASSLDPLPAT